MDLEVPRSIRGSDTISFRWVGVIVRNDTCTQTDLTSGCAAKKDGMHDPAGIQCEETGNDKRAREHTDHGLLVGSDIVPPCANDGERQHHQRVNGQGVD